MTRRIKVVYLTMEENREIREIYEEALKNLQKNEDTLTKKEFKEEEAALLAMIAKFY